MKKKINYTDEPKDGAELPESGYEVVSRSMVSQKWEIGGQCAFSPFTPMNFAKTGF